MGDSENANFLLVPWFNIEELKGVVEKLFSKSIIDRRKALEIFRSWECRSNGIIPPLILCTAILVKAKIEDQSCLAVDDNKTVCQLYWDGMNEFISIILSKHKTYFTTKAKVCKSIGLPEWLLDLNNKKIPYKTSDLELFRTAARITLNWLEINILKQEEIKFEDYYINSDSIMHKFYSILNAFQEENIKFLNSTQSQTKEKKAINSKWSEILMKNEKLIEDYPDKFVKSLVSHGQLLPPSLHLSYLKHTDERAYLKSDSFVLPTFVIKLYEFLISYMEKKKLLQIFVECLFCSQTKTLNLANRLITSWIFYLLFTYESGPPGYMTKPCYDWQPILYCCLNSSSMYILEILPNLLAYYQPELPKDLKAKITNLIITRIEDPSKLEEVFSKEINRKEKLSWACVEIKNCSLQPLGMSGTDQTHSASGENSNVPCRIKKYYEKQVEDIMEEILSLGEEIERFLN